MERNISDNRTMIKFKAEKEKEHFLIPIINVSLILTLCISAVVCVYLFIINPSLKTILYFILLFFSFVFLLETANEYLNTEIIKFEIFENNFIIIRGRTVNKFDIKECKVEYHVDKTDWLSLDCKGQSFTFNLVRYSKKDLFDFIKYLNGNSATGNSGDR